MVEIFGKWHLWRKAIYIRLKIEAKKAHEKQDSYNRSLRVLVPISIIQLDLYKKISVLKSPVPKFIVICSLAIKIGYKISIKIKKEL